MFVSNSLLMRTIQLSVDVILAIKEKKELKVCNAQANPELCKNFDQLDHPA